MAMVSRICPSCRATVSIDDSKEFGFCEQCGAKIEINDPAAMIPAEAASAGETANAESAEPAVPAPAGAESDAVPEQDLTHLDQQILEAGLSGSVPVDYVAADVPATQTSGEVINSETSSLLVAANRAFDERNFEDAYDKYTKVLASTPLSYDALYRSAICCAYLAASGDPDVGSFETSMRKAMDTLDSGNAVTFKSYVDASSAKDLDITNMLISMFSAGRASETTQSCLDNCKKAYANWLKTATFAHTAVSYIEKESFKQTALSSAIDFCDLIKTKEMTYLAGMETSKEGETSKPIYKTYTPDADLASKFSKLRSELADTFNNLPSRVAKMNELKTNIQTITESVNSLKEQVKAKSSELTTASKSFWDAHPDQYKERRTMRLKSFIIFGVAVLIGLVLYFMKYPIYAAAVAVVGLLASLAKMGSDTKKYDEKVLSFEVKLIQSDLDTLNSKLSVEETSLKDKQKALSDFEKTNK
jgi:outer membrane murein-binding lipoprotein Lpp/endogenous inhibitor of DNA gyrase (YacG/DUF329 family)